MALCNYGDKVGNGEWDEWEYPDCCFLCGKQFEHSEPVVLWAGIKSHKKHALPFIPADPALLMGLDRIGKESGFQEALAICWHVDCVPSFCRRILQDWEKE